MNRHAELEARLLSFVDKNQHCLLEIIQDLVRIPSENTPPVGTEGRCQEYVANFLRRHGWNPEVYQLNDVPGLESHPWFWPGREYQGRPNVGARLKGQNTGRSLILSGHIDTVPRGTQPWTRDPFGGEIEGRRLYGRGSNDMKGGIGTNLFIVEALDRLGIKLKGDLVFESVVDEEFGGVNGTLAGRLKGFLADAAVISEPSLLRVCPAQRGGRTVHINLRGAGGVLKEGRFPSSVIDQLSYFLRRLPEFSLQRHRSAIVHEMYAHHADPVPVSVTKVFTGPWGTTEPITVPEFCRIEMFWQQMPGECQEAVELEFHQWLKSIVQDAPDLFSSCPEFSFPIRWLPGSSIPRSHPLVTELADCAALVLDNPPQVTGLEGPCDMYVFHLGFGIPAVLWGACGENAHGADEFVEIDSVVKAAKALLVFVCRWCGVA